MTAIPHKIDVNTLEQHAEDSESLELNGIALSEVALTDKVAVDTYQVLPQTGSFIVIDRHNNVIDRHNNVTVGAGMVVSVSDEIAEEGRVYSPSEKDLNAYVRKHFPEWGCIEI